MSRTTFTTFFAMPAAAGMRFEPTLARDAYMADPIAIDVQYTARQLDAMLQAYPELEVDEGDVRVVRRATLA